MKGGGGIRRDDASKGEAGFLGGSEGDNQIPLLYEQAPASQLSGGQSKAGQGYRLWMNLPCSPYVCIVIMTHSHQGEEGLLNLGPSVSLRIAVTPAAGP